MASYRHSTKPVRSVPLSSAHLFSEDVDFIRERGQHPGTIAREALHIYCEAWRSSNPLPIMTKEERDKWIMNGVPGGMELQHTKPDPGVYVQVIDNPTISTHTPDLIKRPLALHMGAWSKAQRDIYILYGTSPGQ